MRYSFAVYSLIVLPYLQRTDGKKVQYHHYILNNLYISLLDYDVGCRKVFDLMGDCYKFDFFLSLEYIGVVCFIVLSFREARALLNRSKNEVSKK
jgi:hypothetical protein